MSKLVQNLQTCAFGSAVLFNTLRQFLTRRAQEMNRANQAALFQQTNQGLLNIRQLELNYHINLNVALGTQAALIGGFSFALLTQAGFTDDGLEYYAFMTLQFAWLFCACTVAAAVHVIIQTMLMQVLGPGLALHGPIGSMAKASQGMREEQRSVILAFSVMLVTFSLSTVLVFYTVLSLHFAIAASGIFVVAARCWWYYGERIYLRFYWEIKDDVEHFQSMTPGDGYAMEDTAEPQLPEHLRHLKPNRDSPLTTAQTRELQYSVESSHHLNHNPPKQSPQSQTSPEKKSLFSKLVAGMSSAKKNSKDSQYQQDSLTESLLREHRASIHGQQETGQRNAESFLPLPIVTSSSNIAMEGYLLRQSTAKRNAKSLSWHQRTSSFERRYFVFYINADLYFYGTRQEFRDNPKKPLQLRPLHLPDYTVEVAIHHPFSRNNTMMSMVSGGQPSITTGSMIDEDWPPNRRPSTSVMSTAGQSVNDPGATSTNPNAKLLFQLTLTPKNDTAASAYGETMSTVAEESHSDRDKDRVVVERENEVVREPWVLRADTEEEIEMWIRAMRQISPSSF